MKWLDLSGISFIPTYIDCAEQDKQWSVDGVGIWFLDGARLLSRPPRGFVTAILAWSCDYRKNPAAVQGK